MNAACLAGNSHPAKNPSPPQSLLDITPETSWLADAVWCYSCSWLPLRTGKGGGERRSRRERSPPESGAPNSAPALTCPGWVSLSSLALWKPPRGSGQPSRSDLPTVTATPPRHLHQAGAGWPRGLEDLPGDDLGNAVAHSQKKRSPVFSKGTEYQSAAMGALVTKA